MPVSDRKAFLAIGGVSALALGLLFWLVYGAAPGAPAPAWARRLPHVNAGLNSLSTVLMVLGVLSVRAGHKERHRAFMLAALACSALFLASYLTYHHFQGDTRFPGQGWVRPLYFFILVTHIALSAVVLPLLLTVVWFAGLGAFERHKRLARWVFPLWLYVSLSGVAVYLFLRPYY